MSDCWAYLRERHRDLFESNPPIWDEERYGPFRLELLGLLPGVRIRHLQRTPRVPRRMRLRCGRLGPGARPRDARPHFFLALNWTGTVSMSFFDRIIPLVVSRYFLKWADAMCALYAPSSA